MQSSYLRTTSCAAILVCWLTAPAVGAGMTYQLTVRAGKHDRANVPVCVLLTEQEQQANLDPKLLAEARSVTLSDEAGGELPAQLTPPGLMNASFDRPGLVARELHFILPSLKRGASARLTAVLSDKPLLGEGFAWKHAEGEHAELGFCGRPVLRYMCKPLDSSTPEGRDETYKVYHHLYNPAGTRFATKGAGGKYPHHRGLFYGFNRVSYGDVPRIDLWGCRSPAHQSHDGFLSEEAGPVLGRHTVKVGWHGPGDEPFATETREMTVYNVPGGQLVEFASLLSSTVGKVKLDGDPQHAGFHFRAAQEVADGDQKLTYYLRPDGQGEPGETRNWSSKSPDPKTVNLPWNAMSFVIEGNRYTAVYLDPPTNPKEARYSERTYGRFGSYFEFELDEGKDLETNYRVWLQDGEMTVAEAAARSADFVEPVVATVD
jgi:hypothetical protein